MSILDSLRGRKPTPPSDPGDVYRGLRAQAISTKPEHVGLAASTDEVYGVVTDLGTAHGSATIVSMADGTTSMYTSAGGGTLGAGRRAEVAAASKALVERGEHDRALFARDWQDDKLDNGDVRIVLVTRDGSLGAKASANALATGSHVLSPIFIAANNVITRLRLAAGG